jgi:glutamate transport system substrate-binding protein
MHRHLRRPARQLRPAPASRVRRRAALALLGCLAATACGVAPGGGTDRPSFPEGSTMAQIQERGILTVGTKFDQPLIGYREPDNGRITGFDAEIARYIAAELTGSPANIRFVEAVTRNREKFLREGVVDIVLATYSITPQRERAVDFTRPYYYANQDVLLRAGETKVTKVADLAGKSVCTVSGSTSYDRIRALVPTVRVTSVDLYSECALALREGRTTAVTTDDTILLGLMSKDRAKFTMLGQPFSREPYGMAVRDGDTAFRDYLDGLIGRILADGRWDAAYRSTLGRAQPLSPSVRPTSVVAR